MPLFTLSLSLSLFTLSLTHGLLSPHLSPRDTNPPQFLILFLCHWIACAWWTVGVAPFNLLATFGNSWIFRHNPPNVCDPLPNTTQHRVAAIDALHALDTQLALVGNGFSVEQFLEVFAISYRLSPVRRKNRVERAIELTRIGERRRDKVTELSKGWKQRVLLAKTLIHDPSVLLLDEPAAGLDPAARIEFREIIKTLRDLGKTVLVSSHNLTELALKK